MATRPALVGKIPFESMLFSITLKNRVLLENYYLPGDLEAHIGRVPEATGAALPCDINTSIWRSSTTICSALNLFFGMTKTPFQSHTKLGPKKPGQATVDAVSASDLKVVGLALRCDRKIADKFLRDLSC